MNENEKLNSKKYLLSLGIEADESGMRRVDPERDIKENNKRLDQILKRARNICREGRMKYKLHEQQKVADYLCRFAVPGGWLYEATGPSSASASICFVPDPSVEIEEDS